MTLVVGVRCADGVVVGADGLSTSAAGRQGIVSLRTEKVAITGDRIISAMAGPVGLGQRFKAILELGWAQKLFQDQTPVHVMRTLSASAINDFSQTGVPRSPDRGWSFGALLAAPLRDRAELIEFGSVDLQGEIIDEGAPFVVTGSGQMLAEPFLAFLNRVLWLNRTPTVSEAIPAVMWTFEHAIQVSAGQIGEPVQIATLQREAGQWRARQLSGENLITSRRAVSSVEGNIGRWYADATGGDTVTLGTSAPATRQLD